MIRRRQWLKVGLGGAALLAVAGVCVRGWPEGEAGRAAPAAAEPPALLPLPGVWSDSAQACIQALAPVVCGFSPDGVRAQQVALGVRTAVAALAPHTQTEVGELMNLLSWRPVRGLLCGIWTDWPDASAADVQAFLQRWRHHPWPLLQSAYHALHDLILGAAYADPESWSAIGYPGPPQLPPFAA